MHVLNIYYKYMVNQECIRLASNKGQVVVQCTYLMNRECVRLTSEKSQIDLKKTVTADVCVGVRLTSNSYLVKMTSNNCLYLISI